MQYHTPSSFDDAVAIAKDAEGVTRFLAGGTDVLVQLRADIVTPDVLIDVKKIDGVSEIARDGEGWRIGVAVTGAEMTEHDTLSKDWPGVVEAMDLVGSTQIQGRATLTGNLCNGSPAADSVPAMVAAGATVSVTGPSGARTVAVEDIPTAPRTEMDIAVVGCAVNLRLDGKKIVEARVALGAVAPTVLVVAEAADAIIGTELDDAALEALAAAASAACNPITDKRGTVEFRTQVAGVLARRAAKIAYDRAEAAS